MKRLRAWSVALFAGKPDSLQMLDELCSCFPCILSVLSSEEMPSPEPSFQVNFQINQHILSGLKVDHIKVVNETGYKPFKGVRTFVKSGSYEVRW